MHPPPVLPCEMEHKINEQSILALGNVSSSSTKLTAFHMG